MIKKFLQSELVRNGTVLISGNAIGQIVTLLVYIFLSYIYSKDDFGVFGVFLSVVTILNLLATGRYEDAIMLSSSQKESKAVIGLSVKLVFVFSIGLFFILFVGRNHLFSFLKIQTIVSYWYWIPITVFFTGLFAILTQLANKNKRYKWIAASNISLNSTSSALKIGFKYILPGASGLIVGHFLGQCLACFSFIHLKNQFISALPPNWKEEKQAALTYKAFPQYNMTRQLVYVFSNNLPFLWLISYFGGSNLGLLTMASTLLFRPVSLISNSFYQALFEKTNTYTQLKERIQPLLTSFLKNITVLFLPFFIIAYLMSPWLFSVILSAEWTDLSIYFRIMLPWTFIKLFSSSLSFLPLIFHKQQVIFGLEVILLLVRLLALQIGIYYGDFQLCITLYAWTGFFFSMINLVWYLVLIGRYERSLNS